MLKKIICKGLIGVCLIFSMIVCVNSKASNYTGYDNIKDIIVPNGSKARLLVQIPKKEKEKAIKDAKWKFMGWSTKNITKQEMIKYEAKTIFSRSNKTSEAISFKYNVTDLNVVTNTTSFTGSITSKASGKIKSISISGENSAKVTTEKVTRKSHEEATSFMVNIYPNRKVSLIIKGMAEVTNGGGKFYFLGMPLKKGNYEFIDVLTEYYELYEEVC